MAMADADAMKRDWFETVRAWHEAVNRGDVDALLALSDDEIEIGGPRGSARGSAVLRDWLERAGIRLEPCRWFASPTDRKSTRLNSSHANISYAVFCLKKKKKQPYNNSTSLPISNL